MMQNTNSFSFGDKHRCHIWKTVSPYISTEECHRWVKEVNGRKSLSGRRISVIHLPLFLGFACTLKALLGKAVTCEKFTLMRVWRHSYRYLHRLTHSVIYALDIAKGPIFIRKPFAISAASGLLNATLKRSGSGPSGQTRMLRTAIFLLGRKYGFRNLGISDACIGRSALCAWAHKLCEFACAVFFYLQSAAREPIIPTQINIWLWSIGMIAFSPFLNVTARQSLAFFSIDNMEPLQ